MIVEIDYAAKVVKAAEQACVEGRSFVVVKDNFISPPMLKATYKVLSRQEAVRNLDKFGRS